MAKDPAFLFYPNDWLGGTMGMTFDYVYAETLDLLLSEMEKSGETHFKDFLKDDKKKMSKLAG